jgi:hypothetical protein
MKSEPEPKEFNPDIKQLQLPRKLAGKGVDKKDPKKAASKGNDKDRTGKLEDAPAGFTPADKGMMKVQGDGPIHKGGNASFVETN